MQIDWGFIGFLITFFGLTAFVAIGVIILTFLHLRRPKIFDKKFLRAPHFTDSEIMHAGLGGIMGILFTELVILLLLFPTKKNFAWRKLGDMRNEVPNWYRYLGLISLFCIFFGLLIGFGGIGAFYIFDNFLE